MAKINQNTSTKKKGKKGGADIDIMSKMAITKFILGITLVFIALFMLIAFSSFLYSGAADYREQRGEEHLWCIRCLDSIHVYQQVVWCGFVFHSDFSCVVGIETGWLVPYPHHPHLYFDEHCNDMAESAA